MIVDLGASGIASADVEGYLAECDVVGFVKDYLLVDSDRDRERRTPRHPRRPVRVLTDLGVHLCRHSTYLRSPPQGGS